ncbi:chromate efflux transporter [Aquicoccus sp. SU-CL01552]|uniref:chromate efflux transporter n=1 Tax=Aquicoccus sp. SU-CL01552 TaxID=3127656 RepID=UPI0031074352
MTDAPDRIAAPPAYRALLRVFGRIGLLSFGGPAAQIALMHRELVEERDWLDEPDFLRALSLCMLLPGPEAMQLATYAGWRLRGVPGGLIAGGLFVLPGALLIAVLVALYAAFGALPPVQAAFLGIKAAVILIVVQALRGLTRKALTSPGARILAGLSFAAIFVLNLPFPLIVAGAALWGWVAARGEAISDTPQPSVPAEKPLRTALGWLVLWLGPLAALTAFGAPLLAQIGWFFAWLAVISFGGAYAVLAYMTQTVVDAHGWISTAQMIDALGLAETTPGPLILVTQFVAMLTGQLQGGPVLALAAGAVALWATFVPCFLWIFLAAPYMDRLATRPRLSAALGGVTAAVAGVILNLSVWFALHVLFGRVTTRDLGPASLPWPELATLDPVALGLVALAAALILRARRGIGVTLVVMAGAGLLVGTL